jgi:hypothetical protein
MSSTSPASLPTSIPPEPTPAALRIIGSHYTDRDTLGMLLSSHITHGDGNGALIHSREFESLISDIQAWAKASK